MSKWHWTKLFVDMVDFTMWALALAGWCLIMWHLSQGRLP